jgi:hypothetical protein
MRKIEDRTLDLQLMVLANAKRKPKVRAPAMSAPLKRYTGFRLRVLGKGLENEKLS